MTQLAAAFVFEKATAVMKEIGRVVRKWAYLYVAYKSVQSSLVAWTISVDTLLDYLTQTD